MKLLLLLVLLIMFAYETRSNGLFSDFPPKVGDSPKKGKIRELKKGLTNISKTLE